MGLPGAVIVNGGVSSSSIVEKRSPWLTMQKGFNFNSKKEIAQPMPVEEIRSGLPIALFLLYPALSFVTAPYLAPYTEKLLDKISTISQTFLAVVLDLLSGVGSLYKIFSEQMAKITMNAYGSAIEITLKFNRGLNNLRGKMMNQFRIASGKIYPPLSMCCSQARSVVDAIGFFMCAGISKSKNWVTCLVMKSISMVSDTMVIFMQDSKKIIVLLTSLIEQGFDSFSKFSFSAACDVATQTVAIWEILSSSLVYVSEPMLGNTMAGFCAMLCCTKAIGLFFSKSIAKCFAITRFSVSTLTKHMRKSLEWFNNKSPVWLDNFVGFMPFLEKEENQIALTKPAQAALYLASIVCVVHPTLQPEPSTNRVVKTVTTAFESMTFSFTSPLAQFLTGALARGIQLSTTLAYTVQPSLGFGALVNFGAAFTNENWLTCVMAGWFASEKLWTLFGTKAPKKTDQK